jgi:glutamine transport system permease protein
MFAARHAIALIGFMLAAALLAASFAPRVSAQENSTFQVALTGKYPPFSTYDEEGNLVGFDVDVSHAVAQHLGRELEIITTEWDGILAGLLAGKYDAIIGSMAVTPERAEQVNFSRPYYVSGAQLFVHEDYENEIEGIEDCAGKPVGVVLGETFERYLRENRPEVSAVTYKSTVDIFQDVANGRLVGFVSDKLLGAWQIKEAGRPFVPAGNLLYTERMAIPVTKDNAELLAGIDEALNEMEQSGELAALFNQWFGLSEEKAAPAEQEAARMKTSTVVHLLARGFGITLYVAAASLLLGFLLAVPMGGILNAPAGPARWLLRAFNDFVRGTPVLIQLFFVYFGSGQIGLNFSPLTAAIFTLTVNASAYMAEVVRSGLMSVDPGQSLAGRALGLSKWQVFSCIIWPQAFRIAMPPLMNSVVALLKDTALISVISVGEVVREAQAIISVTFDPMKYYFIVAVLFFIVAFPLMKLAERLERKMKERGFAYD